MGLTDWIIKNEIQKELNDEFGKASNFIKSDIFLTVIDGMWIHNIKSYNESQNGRYLYSQDMSRIRTNVERLEDIFYQKKMKINDMKLAKEMFQTSKKLGRAMRDKKFKEAHDLSLILRANLREYISKLPR
jgi:hypothetical protein